MFVLFNNNIKLLKSKSKMSRSISVGEWNVEAAGRVTYHGSHKSHKFYKCVVMYMKWWLSNE